MVITPEAKDSLMKALVGRLWKTWDKTLAEIVKIKDDIVQRLEQG